MAVPEQTMFLCLISLSTLIVPLAANPDSHWFVETLLRWYLWCFLDL